jgi:hypothetical protein
LLPSAPCSMLCPYTNTVGRAVERWKPQLLLPHTASRTMRRWKWHAVKFRPQTSHASWRPQSIRRWCVQAVSSITRVWRGAHPQPPISCGSLSISTASPQTS